jgi:hypothetical protein
MKIEFEDCCVEGDVIRVVAKFTAQLSEIEKVPENSYEKASIRAMIMDAIISKISDEYLKMHKLELINSVDLKQLVDGIQLKIVEGFSLHSR